jgi:hypothetical protein
MRGADAMPMIAEQAGVAIGGCMTKTMPGSPTNSTTSG